MRAILLTLALLAMAASAAQAATLEVRFRWEATPGSYGEPVRHEDLVYDGEGYEANDVTVATEPSKQAVVFTDPGTRIRVVNSTGPDVYAAYPVLGPSWQCASGARAGAAVCASTPGAECGFGGCGIPGPYSFFGDLKVAGNSGDDKITILRTKFPGWVWGVGGNDVIDVANSSPDRVYCGTGIDAVTADGFDVVNADCETVTR
jgi:hypothetical protein